MKYANIFNALSFKLKTVIQMGIAKVNIIIDIDKLKEEKRLVAKVCCVEGCESIGKWHNKFQNFYLSKGMCTKHYKIEVKKEKTIEGVGLELLKAEKALTTKKCCIDGCEKIGAWDSESQRFVLAKGMCSMHYEKQRKYGNPLAGLFVDGRKNHSLYVTWKHLRDRITDEKHKQYPNYGGRGLKMDESWIPDVTGFWQFLKNIAYLGEKPDGHTLDRIDNELGYLIGNLRWANYHQQGANRRSNNETVGVSFVQRKGRKDKWHARLRINKAYVLNAHFDTEQEAIKARKDAEKLHDIIY